MGIERILLGVLVACIPVAAILYASIVRRARAVDPELLDRIDPKGFRAMNASSQLLFGAYVHTGRYRELADTRLRQRLAGFRWLFLAYCAGWVLFLVLMLR